MKPIYAAMAPLLLFACTDMPPAPPSPPDLPPIEDDSCNAARFETMIGQDATALERVLLMGPVRVIRPGTAVTMDYVPERINFQIDDAERISAITCG